LATSAPPGSGFCQPTNVYPIYNYYCLNPVPVDGVEPTLQAGSPCAEILSPTNVPRTCECVEAFIDIGGLQSLPPVFYRCYWGTPFVAHIETLAFEWSATSEYINWYAANVLGTNFDVSFLITGTNDFKWVPLLKVTNHSPSLF
jgi:hypothetical protein